MQLRVSSNKDRKWINGRIDQPERERLGKRVLGSLMSKLEKNSHFFESNRLFEIKINDKVVITEWKKRIK